MTKIISYLAAKFTDLFTIPPVVTGHRLAIHARLKLLEEREGIEPTHSDWVDNTRVVPFKRPKRRITRAVGKK